MRFDFALRAEDVPLRFESAVREQIDQANNELLRIFHSPHAAAMNRPAGAGPHEAGLCVY
ncbi:hypothetical protein CAL26_20820 [Bordetella genomosp. 9]|uniref:Uncharacterized protein n=2 Tax=Bordetella genomosp. 9 TaxID=1416803 RepID=A0A261R5Y8_9BORD|nr:hypothetical protein CAL26_20820 [Bordetella genomosp. 9]